MKIMPTNTIRAFSTTNIAPNLIQGHLEFEMYNYICITINVLNIFFFSIIANILVFTITNSMSSPGCESRAEITGHLKYKVHKQ
jgi:hypothetical protein